MLMPHAKNKLNATAVAGSAPARLRYRRRLENTPEISPLKFLFLHYKCEYWSYEVYDAYRRVFFISLLPLITDPDHRITTGCFASFVSCFGFIIMKPFLIESTNMVRAPCLF